MDIEKSLHPWDKLHLVMMYIIFLMYCWISTARILLRISVSVISDLGLSVCVCGMFVWFWYQGDSWPHKMSLGDFLPLQQFQKDKC